MLKNPFSSRNTRPGALPFRYAASDRASESSTREWTVTRLLKDLNRYRCGAIVGPHGSGKTTLLHDLSPDLAAAMPDGRWVLLTRQPAPGLVQRWRAARENSRAVCGAQAAVPKRSVLVIDGAEQLTPLLRLRIRCLAWWRDHHVLITCHRPLRGFVVLHQMRVTAALVRVLVDELLLAAQSSTGSPAFGSSVDAPDTTENGWESSATLLSDGVRRAPADQNIRKLWSRLYDELGGQTGRRPANREQASAAPMNGSSEPTSPRPEADPWPFV